MLGGKNFFSFSKRQGLEPIEKELQLNGMDDSLKIGLWNVFYRVFIEDRDSRSSNYVLQLLWVYFFKNPADSFPIFNSAYNKIREYYFELKWNQIYDFLMFIFQYIDDPRKNNFKIQVNFVLEEEFSGYRFIDDYIAPITDEQEISTIQNAISSGISQVRLHLKTALEYLSDKDNRDYRNSIKESISAVESLACLIIGNPSASLGDALKEIGKQQVVDLHPTLKTAFEKIYGYTSDADGIRHALKDETTVRFEDAQYMLVSCSAFINYLIAKAQVAGIKLI